jgi:hypothetical protein
LQEGYFGFWGLNPSQPSIFVPNIPLFGKEVRRRFLIKLEFDEKFKNETTPPPNEFGKE